MESRGGLLALKENQLKKFRLRVVGLLLHFWSGEVFRKIGDCCGDFVKVDEDTRRFSQLQWAIILV